VAAFVGRLVGLSLFEIAAEVIEGEMRAALFGTCRAGRVA
jgi:hypothetical protein